MKVRAFPALGAVVAAIAVGCGGVTIATASSRAASATTAKAKTPIVVGNIGTYSGIGGEGGTVAGLTAWAKWANANGGLNGHKIVLKTFDDGGNPTTTSADVQKLISQDHAIVMLDNFTQNPTWESYATQHGVPTISTNPYYGSGLNFSAATTLGAFANSLVIAGATGAKNLGYILCQEFSVCATYANGFKVEAQKLGKTPTVLQVLTSTPDFTAQCLAFQRAGDTAVTIGLAPASIIRMVTNCTTQHYHPHWVIGANTITGAVTGTNGMNGAYATSIDFPWFEDDTPATKLFQAEIRKYVPSAVHDPNQYNPNMSQAWAAGQVLSAVAAKISNHPSSREIVRDLLKVKNRSFGGLTPPVTFASSSFSASDPSKYQQPQVSCFFKLELVNGRWQKAVGAKSTLECP